MSKKLTALLLAALLALCLTCAAAECERADFGKGQKEIGQDVHRRSSLEGAFLSYVQYRTEESARQHSVALGPKRIDAGRGRDYNEGDK